MSRAGEVTAKLARVRGAKSEDTFIADGSRGPVPITNTADWPAIAGGRPAIMLVLQALATPDA